MAVFLESSFYRLKKEKKKRKRIKTIIMTIMFFEAGLPGVYLFNESLILSK